MFLRDLVLRRGSCWPSLLLHCALHPLWGFVQVSRDAGCRLEGLWEGEVSLQILVPIATPLTGLGEN
jgi:hypothetical protein